MPPRAPIGDRVRIEAELSDAERSTLAKWCRQRGIALPDWQFSDDLNRAFTLAAVQALAIKNELEFGLSPAQARRHAAIYCGWDPESVSRLETRRLTQRRTRKKDVMSARASGPEVHCGAIPSKTVRRAAP